MAYLVSIHSCTKSDVLGVVHDDHIPEPGSGLKLLIEISIHINSKNLQVSFKGIGSR